MAQYIPPLPKIAFSFPYRWLNDDKEFLAENFRRKIQDCAGDQYGRLRTVQVYQAIIVVQSYKPVPVDFEAKDLQKVLKGIISGKCLDVEIEYRQIKSRSTLPILDIEFFF